MTAKLQIHPNKRYLMKTDGTPFFYLGDTAWELFHRLNREDADFYLRARAEQKYTVIQAVVLAEFDGLNTPNAYGHKPLYDNDPNRINEDYFQHVDWIVNRAEELGLFIGMLPTWGDKWNLKWGKGPVIFNPENAYIYGQIIGKRYKDKNIIWILGGDRDVETDEHRNIIRAMAAGLDNGDGGAHLMTFHPQGHRSSSEYFHNDDWLDFNMLQSGHADRNFANYNMITKDYNRQPVKLCLDGEPCYEDHPVMGKGPREPYHDEYSVRKAAYWSLFAGSHGHTYGCHDIWQMWDQSRPVINGVRTPWKEAIYLPGARQMQHARKLMESRPFFERIPDQSLIIGDQGTEGEHVRATRSANGSYAFVYIPTKKPVTLDLSKLSGEKLKVQWYDPREGIIKSSGEVPGKNKQYFLPPEEGPDWVLILDDVLYN